MSKINDGGPAFPHNDACNYPGMSLRDYFAGQALVGILANPESANCADTFNTYAKEAMQYADAMIVAREKSKE